MASTKKLVFKSFLSCLTVIFRLHTKDTFSFFVLCVKSCGWTELCAETFAFLHQKFFRNIVLWAYICAEKFWFFISYLGLLRLCLALVQAWFASFFFWDFMHQTSYPIYEGYWMAPPKKCGVVLDSFWVPCRKSKVFPWLCNLGIIQKFSANSILLSHLLSLHYVFKAYFYIRFNKFLEILGLRDCMSDWSKLYITVHGCEKNTSFLFPNTWMRAETYEEVSLKMDCSSKEIQIFWEQFFYE